MKPSNNEFQQVFNNIAANYDTIANAYAIKRRGEVFCEFALGDCLEIGAGTGQISAMLKVSHKVTATDISDQMVEVIKKKVGVEAVACDGENLPFKDKSFDTVIASEVIYYFDNPDKFINEVSRVLKDDGVFLLSVSTWVTQIYDKVRSLLRLIGFKGMYFDDKLTSFILPGKVKALLEGNGWRVIRTKGVMIIPFEQFDGLNRILEKGPFGILNTFVVIQAKKH